MTDETKGPTETAPEPGPKTSAERASVRTDGEPGEKPAFASVPPPIEARPSRRAGDRGRAKDAEPISATDAIARIRTVLATALFTVAVLAALVLALGATLVALGANQQNVIVAGILSLAYQLQGPFADIFTFDSEVKMILVNWGIAAVVFLVVGRVLERVIRP